MSFIFHCSSDVCCSFDSIGYACFISQGISLNGLNSRLSKPPYHSSSTLFFFLIIIYLFLAVLGLRFCARAFSSCGKPGPLFIAVRGPLTIVASLVAEHRLQTHRLSSCGSRPSCSAACGIFPDQGSNPCALHQQADSQPLRHQGSPPLFF